MNCLLNSCSISLDDGTEVCVNRKLFGLEEYVKECKERVSGESSNTRDRNEKPSKFTIENKCIDQSGNGRNNGNELQSEELKGESESEGDMRVRLRDAAVNMCDSEIEPLIDDEAEG